MFIIITHFIICLYIFSHFNYSYCPFFSFLFFIWKTQNLFVMYGRRREKKKHANCLFTIIACCRYAAAENRVKEKKKINYFNENEKLNKYQTTNYVISYFFPNFLLLFFFFYILLKRL